MKELRSPTLRVFLIVLAISCGVNVLLLASPIYMLQVYDRVLTTGHTETLLYLTIIVGFALAGLAVFDAMRLWVLSRLSHWLGDQLSPQLFMASLDQEEAAGYRGAGPLRDLRQVQSFIGGQSILPFFDAPWAPFFLLIIWMLHWWLGVVAVVAGCLLLILSLVNEKITREPLQKANSAQTASFNLMDGYARNFEVVRAMGMVPNLYGSWRRVEQNVGRNFGLATENGGLISGISKFVRLTAQMAVLGFGALLVLQGKLSAGSMIAGSILMGRALAPIEQALGTWKAFVGARGSFKRLQEFWEAECEDKNEPMQLPAPVGHVSMEAVSFAPDLGKPPVLKAVTFGLEPGDVMGLIGPSASGKTTLCRLLVGVHRATKGSVRIDKADISHWTSDRLGPFIGYLPQDVELFSGTIAQNIARMGQPDADKVVEAAGYANVHDMILGLPGGYDTKIGPGGLGLSAGQRQRVGLARAIYGEPKIVVLDEPNANLDHDGEDALLAAIEHLKSSGTTVVISVHQPKMLLHATKVLVLRNGFMQGFGPRDEILRKMNTAAIPAVSGASTNKASA